MDPHRVNEYGTSADNQQQPPVVDGADQQQSLVGGVTQQQSLEGGAEDEAVETATSQSSDDSELSLDGDNNELRRRLHKSED